MRIPPAVAQQIGAAYAAARVNEGTSRQLEDVTRYTDGIRGDIARGVPALAVRDAHGAAALLRTILSTAEPSFAPSARTAAQSAHASIGALIEQLHVPDVARAEALLTEATQSLDRSIGAARGEAAALRQHAQELSAPFLGLAAR